MLRRFDCVLAPVKTDMLAHYEQLQGEVETAGEHCTPREVIRLMVNLLFIEGDDILSKPCAKATLYDPACGTGGMSYAICRSDRMVA